MNISTAIKAFVTHCRLEQGLSPLTLNAYQLDLRQFVERLEGAREFPLADINKNTIRSHLEWLDQRYKPRSIKRKLATLKSFFTFLEQEECIDSSPFRKLRLRLERAKNLPRTISATSVAQLLQCAYDQRDSYPPTSRQYEESVRDIAVVETLFSTGMRVSELCKLKLSDVDLQHKQILIMGKGKRERVVPICGSATLTALESYASLYAHHLSSGESFFLNRDKFPLSDQSVRRIVRKYQLQAGIPETVTPHMFRHTIATMLLENGVDIRNIQTLLGHSSLAVTEIYTHVSLSAQREALEGKHPREGFG